MAEERVANYIERLPDIIEREEKDVSHLDPEMLEILYPARADREFTIGISFGPLPLEQPTEEGLRNYERALELARGSRRYRSEGEGRYQRHTGTFGVDEVHRLYELFELVGEYPSCEILVKGKRVPYARELWLPFFWFFMKDEH
jgi:hypothetical protein